MHVLFDLSLAVQTYRARLHGETVSLARPSVANAYSDPDIPAQLAVGVATAVFN